MKTFQPLAALMAHSADGKLAAIWVKISSDMPLPMPLSVTSSPSHMTRPVPAVIVATMMSTVTIELLGTRSAEQPGNSGLGVARATDTRVVDCRIARPMVR